MIKHYNQHHVSFLKNQIDANNPKTEQAHK
jgi:hypothetical protein